MKKKITLLLVFFTTAFFSQEIKFGKVSKKELEEQFYPLDSTANAAYLYKKRRTYYRFVKGEGFKVITEVHKRIKIYTKQGLNYGNLLVAYYTPKSGARERVTGVKAFTFNLIDGKIEKEKITKKNIFNEERNKKSSVKKVVLPNVRKGAVLDVKYEIISPYSYSLRDVVYQYNIPLKEFLIQIEIPEYYMFNKQSKGYYFAKHKASKKNGKISFGYNDNIDFTTNVSTFYGSNVPSLKDDEPYIGNANNYRGGVKFELSSTRFPNSTFKLYTTSWDKVSKKIYEFSNFGKELNKSSYFKKDLESLLSGIVSDKEKLVKIFQFVKSKVKWNEYNGKYTDKGVKKAYKEGVGNVADINLMLTAMLREAGLNANPVLISTKDNGVPLFPTIDGFNYVISMVEFPDNTYVLLDATEFYSTTNTLPMRVLNWQGRKVTKSGESYWVDLTPKRLAKEDHKIFGKINEENEVEGIMRTSYTGINALNYRGVIKSLTNEEIISKLEEKHIIEIDELKITNKENTFKPIGRNVKFVTEDYIEEIGNKKYLTPLLFFTKEKNPFKLEERKYPVDFIAPWQDKYSITLSIPEGYKIEKIPETMAIGMPNNIAVFKYRVLVAGDKIKVLAIIQFNNAIISPVDYKELKSFYSKIIAKQSERIVLIKE